ncbi:MAG: hypothetical protein WCE38_00405 [Burkholderiales bacterium]
MHLPHLKAPDLSPPVGLSKETDDQVRWLNAAVSALRYHVEKFAAALELYRFGRSKPANMNGALAWDWQWISIHEAAMRMWFLRDAMDSLRRKSILACSAVASLVDDDAMERAMKRFNTRFPEFKKIRDMIAHVPGLELAPRRAAPKDGLYAGPQLKDSDRFELVNDGIRFSMDMTSRTLDWLTEVLDAYWSAFKSVERAFDERGRSE